MAATSGQTVEHTFAAAGNKIENRDQAEENERRHAELGGPNDDKRDQRDQAACDPDDLFRRLDVADFLHPVVAALRTLPAAPDQRKKRLPSG